MYQRSALISRAGYSGVGADDPHATADLIDAYKAVKPMGDYSLTSPAVLVAAGVAYYFLFFRKKKR